jgi:hypothetical protein
MGSAQQRGMDRRFRLIYLLPSVRIAWLTLYKTKPELENISRELGELGGDDDYFKQLVNGIIHAREFFENFVTVLDTAELRLMCSAASALKKDDPEEFARA